MADVQFDEVMEVETAPAMEVHLSEPTIRLDKNALQPPNLPAYGRLAIIWINGKRWQGYLFETEETHHA